MHKCNKHSYFLKPFKEFYSHLISNRNIVQDWRVCQTEIFVTSCYNWLRLSASLEISRTLWIKPCNTNKHDFLQVSVLDLSQALSSWCYSFFQGQMILHALWHFFISSTQPAFHLFFFFFPQFSSCLCQKKPNPLKCRGKTDSEKRTARDRRTLVRPWTSSLHMNQFPGGCCPSPGQLPAGGGADVWVDHGQHV